MMAEIKSEIEYESIIERIEELLPMVDNDTPMTNRYMIELNLLSEMVADYEEKHHPIEPPTFKEVIQEKMAEMKISQKQLAELLGVSPPRISEYLNGKAEPTLKVARIICKKLDIDPEVILG